MEDVPDISDLGEKLILLMHHESSPIKTQKALLDVVDGSKDWYSRIRHGTRKLTEEKFSKLCSAFGVESKFWYNSLSAFGTKLGYSRYEINALTNKHVPGIDFESRIRDLPRIEAAFKLLKGYWESFYFSVSNTKQRVVSRDFFHISSIDSDGFIECEIIDMDVIYKGWGFMIVNHLYFMLEKKDILNEIIVYCTNIPDRRPPRLYGIILCLSGGGDEVHTWPCGAKCAFRFIGNDDEVKKRYGPKSPLSARELLIATNATQDYYIDPQDKTLDAETKQILVDIENTILSAITQSAPPDNHLLGFKVHHLRM